MLVLTATEELDAAGAGRDQALAGELVAPVRTACSDERCGCARGFVGLASRRPSATATVVDLDHVTEDDLRDAVLDSLVRAGWLDLVQQAAEEEPVADDPDEVLAALVDEHVEAIALACAAFPVGAVVRRDGSRIVERTMSPIG